MFELNRKNKERLANLPAPKNKEIFETFLYKHYKVNYTHPHGHEEVSSVHVNIVADCCLEFLAFLKKPLPEYTTDELLKICGEYEIFFNTKTKVKQIWTVNGSINKPTNQSLSKETMKKYASSVKTFLRYCADNEIIEDALINKLRRQKIFNISYSETPRYNFLNDINEKERDAIVFNQAKKPFEFAWLSLMRETGARIGEIMNLKINMVIQKEGQQYVEVVLDGKTGRRVVPIINSMAPLLKWLELHPSKDNPNARVFCGYRYSPNDGKRYYAPLKPMSHVYFGHRLRKIADSLGIKKNVRCQLFRHLKAVSMKKKNVTEPVANELMGWSKNSKMYGYYGAGNPDAKINAVFELAGIKRQENKELEGQFKVCQNCHEINAAEKAYCQRCSSELSFSKPSTEIPEIKAMIERLEKLEQLQQYNIAEANRKITAMSQQDYEKLLIKLEEK